MEPLQKHGHLFFRSESAPEQDAILEDRNGREFVAFLLRLVAATDRRPSGRLAEEWPSTARLAASMKPEDPRLSKRQRQRPKLALALAQETRNCSSSRTVKASTDLAPSRAHRRSEGGRRRAAATVIFRTQKDLRGRDAEEKGDDIPPRTNRRAGRRSEIPRADRQVSAIGIHLAASQERANSRAP